LHGTGQGSGNSPVIWCFISSKLFQAYNTKAHGITFSSPTGDTSLRVSIIGFVDDSTCITEGLPGGTLKELLFRMEEDAQLWNDLLWSSGGKLELPKCSYHVIYYDFESSGVPIMRHRHNFSLDLKDAHNQSIPITPHNIYQPHKTLGHYKAPAGQNKTQFAKSLSKAKEISNQNQCKNPT
jgi:hypothetical protein